MPDSTAGLAALVYKLQKRLDSLQDAVNSHSGLATDLADLTQRVRTLIAAGKEQPAPPAPVWFGLSKEEFGAQLRELAGWVEPHLRATYGEYLGEALRDCWAQHPGAVWELSTLRAEWDRVYGGDEPSLSGALAWHDRWLPGVRSRLEVTMTGCRHQRPQVSGWGTR